MKITKILAAVIVALAAVCVRADTWTDPATGYTWTYTVSGDTATIYKGYSTAAISPKPTGALTIPTMLGGKRVTSIGGDAFNDCSGLTSVAIPNSVTSIGSSAFVWCSGLTSVMIPDSVTSIGNWAFYDCSGLTSVTIPNSVTIIGATAFYGCIGLTTVTIPDSVKSIGDSAFYGCSGLTSVTIGNSVADIGPYAFRGCSGLASLKIPDSVKSIGSSAFSGCSGLTSVKIGDGVTSIGSSAFSGCSGLTSVKIPDSVTSIARDAFNDCSGLTSVTIPQCVCSEELSKVFPSLYMRITNVVISANVTSIKESALSRCSGLMSIVVESGNANYKAVNGLLLSKDGTALVAGVNRNITIPDSVTSIGSYAFSDRHKLTSVTIPGSITSIGEAAFSGCRELTSVTIPSSVTSIGEAAFSGCRGLEEITLPFVGSERGGNESFGYIFGTSSYSGGTETEQKGSWKIDTYYIPSNLKKVVVTDETAIRYGAFANCRGLTSVTIPDSVTSIGEAAFSGCSGLTSVTIPDSVTSIGEAAFSGCSGLEEITLPFVGSKRGNTGSSSSVFGYIFGTSYYAGGYRTSQSYSDWSYSTSYSGTSYITYFPQHLEKVVLTDETAIGYGAFYGCSSLTSITIPDSVTSIGSYAFEGCSGLKSVTIPGSVTSIGQHAFNHCSGLLSFTVERSNAKYKSVNALLLSKDGTALVAGVNGNITIPNSVTSIGNWAFSGCSGLTSVTIPDSVTSIGGDAFNDCSGLTSVTIPNSVKSIEWGAFSGCRGLTSVTIPNSVTSIGNGAFEDCSGLTCVTIPNSVTSIGNSAFSGCSGLTSVTIPSSVTSIGPSAFSGCSGVMSFTVGIGNANYKTVNGLLLSKDGKTLVAVVNSDVVIPNSVTNIPSRAFYGCTNLTSVTIPSSVTSIGDSAFNGCSGLTSVTMPNSVTSIGSYAFYGCSGLTSVTIPDSVTSIGAATFYGCIELMGVTIPDSVTSIGNYAFSGCSGLTSVTIPDSVTNIGYKAFYDCSRFTSITIPDSVTSIGSYAFEGCSGLKSVTIPASVKSVGTDAFYRCYNVRDATVPGWKCGLPFGSVTNLVISEGTTSIMVESFRDCTKLTSVTIPDSVTSIGERAFYNCSGLTSVTIPDSVTSIGSYAFDGCSGLKSVTIPNSVTSIGDYAFLGCSGLTSVTIPDSVTSIGSYAFSGCNGLTSVTIPNSVTSIGNWAFYGCSGLTSVTIPDSVASIGNWAFYGCSGLTSVTIPDSVASIGDFAFSGCSWLTSVTMPDSVTSIGDYAFSGCSGLTSIKIANGTTSIGINSFSGCTNVTSIVVPGRGCGIPSGAVTNVVISDGVTSIAPSAFIGWRGLASITIPDSVTSIGGSAFERCSGLTSVTIPSSVTSIGESAFSGCSALATVSIPDGVKSIGASAFYNCNGLTSMVIPDGVKSIGGSAFYGCSGLTRVVIPNSVTSIGASAFCGCSGLASVAISDGVKSIGASAFSGCSGLDSVAIPDSVTSIGASAFYGCSGLDSVVIPASVTSIGESAFSGCQNVRNATVPGWKCGVPFSAVTNLVISAGTTSVGWGSFSDCSGVKSVSISDSVTNIESYAFYNCGGLTNIILPGSVENIGSYAFSGCGGLTNVAIPDGVKSIGSRSFSGCSGLERMTIPRSVTKIGGSALSGCSRLVVVYVDLGDAERIRALMTDSGFDVSGVTFVESDMNVLPGMEGADEVAAALAGAVDVRLVRNIKNSAEYSAFRRWADEKVVDHNMAMNSPRAWFSYAIDADGLVGKAFQNEDVTIDSPAAFDGSLSFEVDIDGVRLGSSATARNLSTVFEVLGSSSLSDNSFSPENVDVTLGVSENGRLEVHATPKGTHEKFFVRVRMHVEGESGQGETADSSIVSVTFDANCGVGSTSRSVVKGYPVGTLPSVLRDGYTLGGWWTAASDGAPITDSTVVTGDVTYYAHWAKNTYTVTYAPGANGIGPQQTATKTHDEALSLKGATFTRDGYTQTGWSTSDGGAKGYELGASYTVNSSVTLYPFWEIKTYAIVYNPGVSGSGSRQSVIKTHGVSLALKGAIFTRDGFTQTGWLTSDGGAKAYDLGATYDADAGLVLYPVWKSNTYSVAYKPGANGSGAEQTETKTGGVPLTLKGAIFTRDGYTHAGWSTSDGGSKAYDLGASYTVNSSVTLYPFWSVITYTVKYNPGANGSGSQQTATKTYGVDLTLKGEVFARDGFTQTGWSTIDGGAKTYDLAASYTADAAVTLYPFWTVNTYTVAYKPGANGSGTEQAETKTGGVPLTLKGAIFTRSGYLQMGWSTSDGGAKTYDLAASYTANAAVTLYPFWTKTYNVTYKPGANGSGSQQTATKVNGETIALKGAIFTRDGYTQTGWSTSDGGSKAYGLGASYTANAAVTLYPFWTVNTYSVTYNPGTNGSGTQQTGTKTHGVALVLNGEIFTRDGYTQTGWSTSDGGDKAYNLGASYTENTALTLYPFWTLKTYTITYKPGANGSGSQQTATKTHGEALTLKSALFTRDGYTQTGWATSDGGAKAYNIGASYTANAELTLYPVWTAKTYTVTYKPGANGSGSQLTAKKTHDVSLTLKSATFTRDGYTQTGWSKSDGGAKAYNIGASYTANAAITLYPFWTANTYTVTYNPGTSGSGAQQTAAKTHDVAMSLKSATFTRDGYTQAGWSTSDGGEKAYELGASYTANAAITLYPFWTLKTYTITYKPGANGSGSQQTATKTHGVALVLSDAIFAREGYTQTGWSKSDGGAKAYDLGISYTSNAALVLYPFWTAHTYVVTYHPGANGTGSQQTVTKTHDVPLVLNGPKYTRDGFVHRGWATSDGGEEAYYLSESYTANAAVTLYPYWEAIKYSVTYKPGANGTGSQQSATKTGGVALKLKDAIFTRDGYTQTGWSTSDGGAKVYDLGASYTANKAVSFYPYWTVNTYTITYKPGASGSGAQQVVTKTHAVTLALKDAIFTRSGYTQTGWSTSDGGAKAYDLGASYTANAAVILYPYWIANTYTVTYKPGANGTGTQQTATKTHDEALVLKNTAFTRDGYMQTGWSTSDGGAKVYELGASYTANKSITLYPFWTADPHGKVQLWAGGPYWATTNIGADKPEEYGYYFWWGDTVGYRWVNNKWVANDGSSASFSFARDNTPTCKIKEKLRNEGWITADYVLAPEHDAAHVQWGGTWRMPTFAELSSLNSKCTWLFTTKNGVSGFLISGKGAYSSNSIFLPCARFGFRNRLDDSYYMWSYIWSSTPSSENKDYMYYYAYALSYNSSGNHEMDDEEGRSNGFPIRPVQSYVE